MADKMQGNLQTGRFKYNDGGWYVGQHCGDGKRHGQGIYTYPNGDVFDGSFIMGKYVLRLHQFVISTTPNISLSVHSCITRGAACYMAD